MFECYADFKEAAGNWYKPPYSYGVFGTETVQQFEQEMANHEGAEYALAFPSGMAAIATTLGGLLSKDETLALQKDVYSITEDYSERYLGRMGITTKTIDFDDQNLTGISGLDAKVLYLESPTYNDYKILDLQNIINDAKSEGMIVVIDNSLATFLNVKPLDMGADAVIYSASKHICGHGDALLGCVMTNSEEIYKQIRDHQILAGYVTSPEDAALGLRGLETLRVRMSHQSSETEKLIDALINMPWINEVRAAGFFAKDGKIINENKSFELTPGLISITLANELDDEQMDLFTRQFQTMKIGYGWGSTISLALPKTGEGKTSIRISVGMDTADNILQDLDNGYEALQASSTITNTIKPKA